MCLVHKGDIFSGGPDEGFHCIQTHTHSLYLPSHTLHVYLLPVCQCVFTGLFMAILVFIADLYFLVKSPRVMDKMQTTGASKRLKLKAKQQ